MADIDVKKQKSTEAGNEQKGLERRENRGLSRHRGWDPFSFSLMPSDFFGTDPFSFMRRFHEEMDRRMAGLLGGESGGTSALWNPAIEVTHRNGQLQIHADLPGMKPEVVRDDIKKLADAGVSDVLVGESLMRSDDIAGKIRELFG